MDEITPNSTRQNAQHAARQVSIPSMVRIKPGALDRIGIYLQRAGAEQVRLVVSEGLPPSIIERAEKSLTRQGIVLESQLEIASTAKEEVDEIAAAWLAAGTRFILGIGGGKSLDVSKYVASKCDCAMYCVPTSLSNDGFASPQASLMVGGRRQSIPTDPPSGVIVDTEVCREAPRSLWHAGVGDLVAKLTAVRDWKLAFHAVGTPVDDLAALLSDASVYQFLARPTFDADGLKLLATALLLNGVSMSICNSSRPASGSEHLISHALDQRSDAPRLHGLQVGVASYLVSRLQQQSTDVIATLFDQTGFWETIQKDPFDREQWLEAIEEAPRVKQDFYTVLSEQGRVAELQHWLHEDPRLDGCFI